MGVTHVVGVDPGLVHTGVVGLVFNPHTQVLLVQHEVILGPDAAAAAQWQRSHAHSARVFIEGYKPRSHYDSDKRMVEAVAEFKRELNGTVLLNHGVKKVVKQPLMELLGCWKFGTVTHHQDLRSAARIAVLGMLKDELLNKAVTRFLVDHLDGRPWRVHH